MIEFVRERQIIKNRKKPELKNNQKTFFMKEKNIKNKENTCASYKMHLLKSVANLKSLRYATK